MTPGKGRIAIAGAGVAGLAAALELAARGWRVDVAERAAELSEVGAGLQLAPNATRHLQRLGVLERLRPQAVTPEALYLVDGRSARALLPMALGVAAEARWGFPYLVCHRADLQAALLDACRAQPAITIRLGTDAVADDADWTIGCDGVWSAMRARAGFEPARFSGHIAWRTTLESAALPASFRAALPHKEAVSAWLGPKAHFIAYPVKSGDFFNFVAITAGENPGEVWSRSGDRTRLQAAYEGWAAPVREALAAAENWTFWPLFEMAEAQFLAGERRVLIGDAAHAVTPFAAQGAAMAIEDAAALAVALDAADREAALRRFEAARKARLAAVAKRGALNRFAYHATGLAALGRNTLFSLRRPERFLKDLDWLYGHDSSAV